MSAIVAPTAKIDQALNESKKRKATEGTSAGQLEKKIKKLNTKSSSSPQSEVKDEETLKEFLKYDYIISMEDSLGEKDEEFKLDDSPAAEEAEEEEEAT
jgi:hypothetical protein